MLQCNFNDNSWIMFTFKTWNDRNIISDLTANFFNIKPDTQHTKRREAGVISCQQTQVMLLLTDEIIRNDIRDYCETRNPKWAKRRQREGQVSTQSPSSVLQVKAHISWAGFLDVAAAGLLLSFQACLCSSPLHYLTPPHIHILTGFAL